MDAAKLSQFLKERVPLFKDFTDAELEALVQNSRLATVEPNEAVIKFGEEGRFLGLLLEGEAEASITDDNGDKHTLAVIRPGEIFGEMSLMTGSKSVADVAGRTRCTVLLVPQQLFSTLLATHPAAVAWLSKTIVDRLRASSFPGTNQELAASALRRSEDPYDLRLKTDQPMKLLVVNADPHALKYALFDTADETKNVRGTISGIGEPGTIHVFRSAKGEVTRELPMGGHQEAFAAMVKTLTKPGSGALRSPVEVLAVGQRVVHGGRHYSNAVIITDEVIQAIEAACELAPYHNPVCLTGIYEARRHFPHAAQVAVFDTAFHQRMPPYAYLYGLPYEYFEKKGIRRYGFHGASHAYVSLKVAEYLKRPYNELETIVCHLGGGASICAVDHGRSVDTSMGLTPSEGLMMCTRSGDLDPAILLHLMRNEGMGYEELQRLVNQEGGLKGISGLSGDVREIEEAANAGHPRALLAIKTFAYRVRKYIGAYVAAMGGVDAVAFTGGIGQGSVEVRSLACQGLGQMGIRIDEKKNREARGFEEICDISADDSAVRVLIVPTDEERMIARETLRTLGRDYVTEILRKRPAVPILVEVSAHHVHLSPEHVEALFGKGYQLTVLHELSQPGQYACKETVNLIGPKGRVENVRVLGPPRKATQVEIAMTEQFKLGIQPPIRESGNIEGSPGLTLEGPAGTVTIDKGVICAARHIHMSPEEALGMGLKDKDVVMVRIGGERELIFGDVVVRVHPDFRLAMHIDTDEGNAGNVGTGAVGYIDRIQDRA